MWLLGKPMKVCRSRAFDFCRALVISVAPCAGIRRRYFGVAILIVGLLLCIFAYGQLSAQEATCILPVADMVGTVRDVNLPGDVKTIRETKAGILVGTDRGLFRYDGSHVALITSLTGKNEIRMAGSDLRSIRSIHDTKQGLVVGTSDGLFRYDGSQLVPVPGPNGMSNQSIGAVEETAAGVLVGTENDGAFRYDGSRLLPVLAPGSNPRAGAQQFRETTAGILVGSYEGLFRYDGSRIIPVDGGNSIGPVLTIQETKVGILVGGNKGLFRYDGSHVVPVPNIAPREVYDIWQTNFGVFPALPDEVRPPLIPVITSENNKPSNSAGGIASFSAIRARVRLSCSYRLDRSFGRTKDVSLGAPFGSCVL
jgi:hypothetical protein